MRILSVHRGVATCLAVALAGLVLAAHPRAQEPPAAVPARSQTLDQLLDLYVRDGYVYYRALKLERSPLDRYVGQLATVDVGQLPRGDQIAFWLNAYNALVLRTIIDHYPIAHRTDDYPDRSIRQIPGAFDRLRYEVAGRMMTLDEIENAVLPTFGDSRLYFAIGRGSVGGGRLRSEAFTPARLDRQLAAVADECVSRAQCVQVDAQDDELVGSAVFSWHEADFVSGYAQLAAPVYGDRSPIERAILAFIDPKLLTSERTFLMRNMFRLAYKPFDWTLNDLTGRGGR